MYLSIMGDRGIAMLQECEDDHPGNGMKTCCSELNGNNIPLIGKLKGEGMRKCIYICKE